MIHEPDVGFDFGDDIVCLPFQASAVIHINGSGQRISSQRHIRDEPLKYIHDIVRGSWSIERLKNSETELRDLHVRATSVAGEA